MKKYILIAFLLLSVVASSQNDEAYVDMLVTEFTAKLEQRGITNWLYTKQFCIGSNEMFMMEGGKMCSSKDTYYEVYVVWKEEGKVMIKKIDNCGLFYSLELQDDSALVYLESHFTAIQEQEIRPYKGQNTTGTPELRTSVEPCRRNYYFKTSEQAFAKKINPYDLSAGTSNPNINFEYNSGLSLTKFDSKLSAVIEAVEDSFRRQMN